MNSFLKAWDIAWSELEIIAEIGRGAFGVVSSARWRDMKVAVKSVTGNLMDLGESKTSEMEKEIGILQKVRHPNIVLCFGAGTSPDGSAFLVVELVELGTLTSYLAQNTVEWALKLSFALDTARGMAHVHGLGRMHRDLKSGNLLVSSSLHIKVADFGSATLADMAGDSATVRTSALSTVLATRDMERARTQRTKGVGTPLWMAPEIIEGKTLYGPSADVYSYGVVMWDIASQGVPWDHVPDCSFFMDELLRRILGDERPAMDAAWPAKYCELMGQCWQTAAGRRPKFAQVVAALEAGIGQTSSSGNYVGVTDPKMVSVV